MTPACTVLIAAPDLLATLKQRASETNSEILAFSDADALRALDVIRKRRPAVVALERLFAATPRGAALINRIKADPTLIASEIRVVSHDTDYSRASPRKSGNGGTAAAVAPPVVPPLDQRGTRRAPRFTIAGAVDLLVDGNSATLVDVSTVGAQVVTASVLKPNQRVRMALTDETGPIRFNASIAWAQFEIPPKSGPRYRAGIEFLDAKVSAVDTYCLRHKT